MDGSLKGDHLPDQDHIGIHCSPAALVLEFGADGEPTSIKSSAFRVDSDGISGNWLEYAKSDDQFSALCALLRQRTVKKSHRVALLNVKDIKETGIKVGVTLTVEHDPIEGEPPNPAHSLVVGATPDQTSLLEALTLIVEIRPFAPAP